MEELIGEIHIRITQNDVEWESELNFTEVVFWLETLKSMMIKNIIEANAE